jgi:hypothetical protein
MIIVFLKQAIVGFIASAIFLSVLYAICYFLGWAYYKVSGAPQTRYDSNASAGFMTLLAIMLAILTFAVIGATVISVVEFYSVE